MKDSVCKERTIGTQIQYQAAHQTGSNEVFEYNGIFPRLEETFPDFLQRVAFRLFLNRRIDVHPGVGDDNGDEGEGIEEENGTVGNIIQQECGEQRSDHAGEVEIGGIQADGAVECLFPHQLGHEGHAGRHIKGIDGTDEKSKKQNPEVRFISCPEKQPQKSGLHHVGALGAQKDFSFVVPVNPEAGEKGKEKAGRKLAG